MAEPTAEATTEPEAEPQAFHAGFEAENQGFVENKGWKSNDALLASYRSLEKVLGLPEDRILAMPDDPSAEGAMDAVYSRLGRPDSAEGYTKAVGDDFQDDAFAKIAATAFGAGVTDAQFKVMQESMNGIAGGVVEAQEAAAAAAFDQWKGANETGFQNAAALMANVGVSEDQLAEILAGDKVQIYDLLATVAKRSAEGRTVEGKPQGDTFAMSPEAAKAEITKKLGDLTFMGRYTNPVASVRAVAIKEMEDLQKTATGGKQ
ncbi:MAG: hypothetical protein GY767_07945 [Shimia sp.]|nr:hypothetical protein [Shimia sp.]